MLKLDGKIALVTGSSRGIGRAIAYRLAAQGAIVAVHYASSAERAEKVVRIVDEHGGRAFAVGADLSGATGVADLFDGLQRGLVGLGIEPRLDILVNNAAEFARASIEDVTEEMLDRVFAVNFKAPFFTIQHALKIMPDGGRIINISSLSAHKALPIYATYGPSKGALEVLTRTLAKQLGARQITVNAVAPGLVMSTRAAAEMREAPEHLAASIAGTALGRAGEVDDIAAIVEFLTGEDARWITGQVIQAAGGSML